MGSFGWSFNVKKIKIVELNLLDSFEYWNIKYLYIKIFQALCHTCLAMLKYLNICILRYWNVVKYLLLLKWQIFAYWNIEISNICLLKYWNIWSSCHTCSTMLKSASLEKSVSVFRRRADLRDSISLVGRNIKNMWK